MIFPVTEVQQYHILLTDIQHIQLNRIFFLFNNVINFTFRYLYQYAHFGFKN